uniref:Uncharacterized protein n=1 Tax=Arundo donax TaxID=35708 RepID=A0A0A9GZJ1_ARUDO
MQRTFPLFQRKRRTNEASHVCYFISDLLPAKIREISRPQLKSGNTGEPGEHNGHKDDGAIPASYIHNLAQKMSREISRLQTPDNG